MYVTLNAPERQLFFSLETDGPTRVLVVSEARVCAPDGRGIVAPTIANI